MKLDYLFKFLMYSLLSLSSMFYNFYGRDLSTLWLNIFCFAVVENYCKWDYFFDFYFK